MRSWFSSLWRRVEKRSSSRPTPTRLALEPLEERNLLAAGFLQTNMVSDIPGLANVTDPNLINPFGLTQTGEFWVSDNNSGVATLYNGIGTPNSLVVKIPPIAGSSPGTLGLPSGVVSNTFAKQGAFDIAPNEPAIFIFDSQDGVISAWSFKLNDPTQAVAKVNNPGTDYTGLAIGTDANGDPLLYAANFSAGTIDVFDTKFQSVEPAGSTAHPANGVSPITLKGAFQDPMIPKGFAPFNVENIGGMLYVEYAKVDSSTGEGKVGPGNGGFVDVFNGDGVLQQRLIDNRLPDSDKALDSPFGVALAPSNFGAFSNDLLVGNFGNGQINAFDPHNGNFLGTVTDSAGNPIVNDHLWALHFGTGTNGQIANALYFTAGIHDEAHGLLGNIQAVPDLNEHASLLPNLPNGALQTFSTVPPNGDQNPYGLAFVPSDFKGQGVLQAGDLLAANFNNAANVQGTGSTITRITPDGGTSVFFQGQPGLGLTTALGVLKNGFVIVGSVPSQGTAASIKQGSLLILDANGHLVKTLTSSDLLDSPWDLTINDQGNTAQVFVSNVVSGTVTRIDLKVPKDGIPRVESETEIASGFTSQPSDAAVILGPTGLAYDAKTDTLYVASTADNAVFAIAHAGQRRSDAGTGTMIFTDPRLRGPLGLVLAPNGDLIVANGDAVNADTAGKQNSELIEFTPRGQFVGEFQVDASAGSAFGLAVTEDHGHLRFAAVDDNTNTVSIWTFDSGHSHTAHSHYHHWWS